MLRTISPVKALEYFENELEFTAGPNELNEMIKNNEVRVIDVRSEQDYKKGHIPGAINVPKSRWGSFDGLSHEKPNIFYCYTVTCLLSTKAAKEFASRDYPVMTLLGGFEEWKKSDLPIEK